MASSISLRTSAHRSFTPERAFLKPLGLHFYNNSGAVGENVRFTGILEEVEGSKTSGDERSGDMSMGIPEDSLPDDRLIKSNLARDAWEITVDVGHIRPGEEVWAGREFRFGAKWSGTLRLKGKFVADNLPEPINCEVPLKVEFVQRLIQRDDLNQDDGFLRMLKKARAL